jgi:iron complex transport system ATP-binding protein
MSSQQTPLLDVSSLSISIAGRTLVENLKCQLVAGEMVALLGKNGAGKTLLLHTLAGLRPPDTGEIRVLGDTRSSLSTREFARRLALLPQDSEDIFPSTVLETALIGRHPHIGRFGWESAEDVAAALKALGAMGLDGLRDRDVLSLSGGERRRLAIAQCLVQDAPVLLLDEPTNHLDPQHRIDSLMLLEQQAAQGKTILMSLHDVNFAARYAGRCLLLFGDGRWQLGETRTILNPDTLEALYGIDMKVLPWQGTEYFLPAFRPRSRGADPGR